MKNGPLVVIGDVLLDVDMDGVTTRQCPDATPQVPAPVIDCARPHYRPGGAGLASLLAARMRGRDVVLIAAVGTDDPGRRIADLLGGAVEFIKLPLRGATPQKIRVRAGSRLLLRVDIGQGHAAAPDPAVTRRALMALRSASAVLVSDYGRGVAAQPFITRALGGLRDDVPIVWDPHPKGTIPLPRTRLATPNEAEAERFTPHIPAGRRGSIAGAARRARRLLRAWVTDGVAVTLGARGAVLATCESTPLIAPAPRVSARDTCGAGDSFAAAAALAIADGATLGEAVVASVSAAARFVATGAATGITMGALPGQRPVSSLRNDRLGGRPRPRAGQTARNEHGRQRRNSQ